MKIFSQLQAHLWAFYYKITIWLLLKKIKYGTIVGLLTLLSLIIISALLFPILNNILETYFSIHGRLSSFQTLLMTLGGSLIGATAIAFSLIMFAMQVNVERMPHGLFRKFSSDLKLLGYFAITFIVAITITCLSLIPDESWAAIATLISFWGLIIILLFLVLAYRRALSLISPTEQLSILIVDTKKHMKTWGLAADRMTPLLKSQLEGNQTPRPSQDMERIIYFAQNSGWTTKALKNITYCFSYAKRYAERGDHEVAGAALNAILVINESYIKAKGRTFSSNNGFVDNPYASDDFINNTLEHLRQNIQVGISRNDERQIEQTFRAMLGLCRVYLTIDYSSDHARKSHALLAAVYLSDAVESIVPHNMPDVLMEGVRIMGVSAQVFLAQPMPEDITAISEKIAVIACVGAVNKKYQPVTQIAMMQLAKLTFELLRSRSHDVGYSLEKIHGDAQFVAKNFLNVPDPPLARVHSIYLAPFYSSTSFEALLAWLTDLTNDISNADENDESAQRVISHIKQWAGKLHTIEKELFLLAIEKKSAFTFDIMHWLIQITKILLAVSNADACNDYIRDELRRSALWLVSILSWVPDNYEAVTMVENYQMTENLFEVAIDAKQRGCDDIALKVRDLLLSWAFKAGKYQNGWGILERACYGLACLNIIFELNDHVLLNAINDKINTENAPSSELRLQASRNISDEANAIHDYRLGIRAIEAAMAEVDENVLRDILLKISEQLILDINIHNE